jgi:hypothetical protein
LCLNDIKFRLTLVEIMSIVQSCTFTDYFTDLPIVLPIYRLFYRLFIYRFTDLQTGGTLSPLPSSNRSTPSLPTTPVPPNERRAPPSKQSSASRPNFPGMANGRRFFFQRVTVE